MKLNIGCGKYPAKDWTNVDFDPQIGGFVRGLGFEFILAEAHKLPFSDQTAESLYSSHLLEHYLPEHAAEPGPTVADLLSEWHRVLVPKGALLIAVPDLCICSFRILRERKQRVDWVNQLFGFHKKLGDTHHYAYTQDMLKNLVERNGFVCLGTFQPWIKNPVGDGFDCAGAHGLDDSGKEIFCSLNLSFEKRG
jgi:predicted SAM-dependent methyltransferase